MKAHCLNLQVIIAQVGDKESTYSEFLDSLPEADCRYGGGPLPPSLLSPFPSLPLPRKACQPINSAWRLLVIVVLVFEFQDL